jgi:hypothetical protein
MRPPPTSKEFYHTRSRAHHVVTAVCRNLKKHEIAVPTDIALLPRLTKISLTEGWKWDTHTRARARTHTHTTGWTHDLFDFHTRTYLVIWRGDNIHALTPPPPPWLHRNRVCDVTTQLYCNNIISVTQWGNGNRGKPGVTHTVTPTCWNRTYLLSETRVPRLSWNVAVEASFICDKVAVLWWAMKETPCVKLMVKGSG